jgi:deazaflavin-dependent oxidoreductase (nitroreductase family)
MPEKVRATEIKQVLDKTDEVKLTVIGRKTGKERTRPVWFVVKGRKLYLVPVTGTDSEWYKNVLADPTVTISAKGVKWTAKGTPITEPGKVAEIVDMFRDKYGAADFKKYYPKHNVAVAVPLPS